MSSLSVILTVYNGGNYLPDAVKSILQQTLKDFEFIIVDNASTDGTAAYLESLRDPRLRLIRLPSNQGQTRALNRAIQESRGTWLARMDADDIALPERLALQSAYLDTHPKAAVVGSWIQEMDAAGQATKVMKYPTDPWEIRCHLLSDGDLTRRCLAHPSVMLKRDALLQVGGYNEAIAYAQDYDLWTRISRFYEVHNIGKVLLQYRSFPESASKRNIQTVSEELTKIVESNVTAIWPEISASDTRRLVRMLRNQSPMPQESPEALGELFDQFFDRAMRAWNARPDQVRGYRDRIKAYYLPRLIQLNPRALSHLVSNTFHQPGLWADSKWLKNIAKRLKTI